MSKENKKIIIKENNYRKYKHKGIKGIIAKRFKHIVKEQGEL